MISPVAYEESLMVATVTEVTPGKISARLLDESPTFIALNTGEPRPFPRINSYLLSPIGTDFIVAQVNWIGESQSRISYKEVIQLPHADRDLSLTPLGVLRLEVIDECKSEFHFSRGVESFPTVGDPVLIPTRAQLSAIAKSGENLRIFIGTSPLAGSSPVYIDPDKLFGRHLAVLGNTGSGKSCSVAGLIRWSLEAARKEKKNANAHFLILDPNGEYSHTFRDLGCVKVYGVEPAGDAQQLKVPLWLWNSVEWISFAQASEKTQKPALIQTLRMLRSGAGFGKELLSDSHRFLYLLKDLENHLCDALKNGYYHNTKEYAKYTNFCKCIDAFPEQMSLLKRLPVAMMESRNQLCERVNLAKKNAKKDDSRYPRYVENDIAELYNSAHSIIEYYDNMSDEEKETLLIDADVPLAYDEKLFLRYLENVAEQMKASEHVEKIYPRIRTLLSDNLLKNVIAYNEDYELADWLQEYICPLTVGSSITIIDLSLISPNLTSILASVIARMALETLQRYRRKHDGEVFPLTLVVEEAHTFIKQHNDNPENIGAGITCARTFEKIAREGRKFGLGLVISSQRPSELSPTVLSQCNTFLLHRITNDLDQNLVSRLVPDNLKGLLRELPVLPSRDAVLLGWATELPLLVRMRFLEKDIRPQSDDPGLWDKWVKGDCSGIDMKEIADEWQTESSAVIKETQEIGNF